MPPASRTVDPVPLACPVCKEPLEDWVCARHGTFPQSQGIPLFARSAASPGAAFDRHWSDHAGDDYPPAKVQVARQFLTPLFDWLRDRESSRPARVLDAGAGDGVHAAVLGQRDDLDYVGLDLSLEGLARLRARCPDAGTLVQGDVLALPFPAGSFDVVFSFGVLGYTPDPALGFAELCRTTRLGGLVGVWLYPRTGGLAGWAFNAIRNFCRWTGPWGAHLIAALIVPFLFVLPTRSRMHLLNASWRQCMEVVLVNVQPRTLAFPTRVEVARWFADNGIRIIVEDSAEPITLWGVKEAG